MLIRWMVIAGISGLLLFVLVGCGSASDAARSVTITMPVEDEPIFYEVLSVVGTTDRGSARFRLLLQREGIIEQQVEVVSDPQGQWRVELLHGYAGESTHYTLVALPPADPTLVETAQPLAVRRVQLAGIAFRP